jgi:hypothetical protein
MNKDSCVSEMQSSRRPYKCQLVLTLWGPSENPAEFVRRAYALLVHLSALLHVNVELTLSKSCKEIALLP